MAPAASASNGRASASAELSLAQSSRAYELGCAGFAHVGLEWLPEGEHVHAEGDEEHPTGEQSTAPTLLQQLGVLAVEDEPVERAAEYQQRCVHRQEDYLL